LNFRENELTSTKDEDLIHFQTALHIP